MVVRLKDVGDLVYERELRNITQTEMSRRLGVSSGYMSMIENSKAPFPEHVRQRAEIVLNQHDLKQEERDMLKQIGVKQPENVQPKPQDPIVKKVVMYKPEELQRDNPRYPLREPEPTAPVAPEPPKEEPKPVKRELTQTEKDDMFFDVAMEIAEQLAAKNHDYGDSFMTLYKRFGDMSTLIRLTDKIERFNTLIAKEAKVKDESVEDTLKDLAGYCILTLVSKQILKQQEE